MTSDHLIYYDSYPTETLLRQKCTQSTMQIQKKYKDKCNMYVSNVCEFSEINHLYVNKSMQQCNTTYQFFKYNVRQDTVTCLTHAQLYSSICLIPCRLPAPTKVPWLTGSGACQSPSITTL